MNKTATKTPTKKKRKLRDISKVGRHPARGSDGRTYVTVYMTPEQLETLEEHCRQETKKLGFGLALGVSTFMRVEALKAAGKGSKRAA